MCAKVGRRLLDEEVAAVLALVSTIDPTYAGQDSRESCNRAWGVHANSYVDDGLRIQAGNGGTANVLYVDHEIGGVVEDAVSFSPEDIVPLIFMRHDLDRPSLEPEYHLLASDYFAGRHVTSPTVLLIEADTELDRTLRVLVDLTVSLDGLLERHHGGHDTFRA